MHKLTTWGAVAALNVWLVATVFAIDHVAPSVIHDQSQRVVVEAAAVLLCAGALLGPRRIKTQRIGKMTLDVFVAATLFILFVRTMVREPALWVGYVLTATFMAALVEEIVFRQMLPTRIGLTMRSPSGDMSDGLVLSFVIAQAAFSVCHLPRLSDRDTFEIFLELARLFAGGLLYSSIAVSTGVWLTTPVHAALNVSQLFVPSHTDHRVLLSCTVAGVVVGLMTLRRASHRCSMASAILPQLRR